MKQIIIKTQEEFDKIKKVEADEEAIIDASIDLKLNSILEVAGALKIYSKIDTDYYGNKYIEARGQSYVEARGQSYVVAWEQSHVVAWGQSHVEARGQSYVVARGQSHVVAWEQSHVVAWGQSHVVARGQSYVEARGQSHVVAWEQSHVVARGQTSIQVNSDMSIVLLSSFAVAIVSKTLKHQIKKKSKTAIIQKYTIEPYLKREGICIDKGNVVLYKRVSKDFKTQEGTKNETYWQIGTVVNHPNWQPERDECGGGKYHAVSRPYFADGFRSNADDKYIAIEIDKKDLYEWKDNPQYPYKIGFERGKVLYECDRYGEKLKEDKNG